ncbi:protein of unknown function [Kyrpidia spormannii]|uniref:Uncharacterized protein n=2 Tax=Kyrpidia spormannii TaxID=2055160 RepID=A0ACA8ZCZ8_9BACL|nr:protein of unknown function [Kyrpidia spormannii]CAB3396186.1 protein of unknown function [Kyrpidia spormannii]
MCSSLPVRSSSAKGPRSPWCSPARLAVRVLRPVRGKAPARVAEAAPVKTAVRPAVPGWPSRTVRDRRAATVARGKPAGRGRRDNRQTERKAEAPGRRRVAGNENRGFFH